jgi:lipid A 4'-phosphatase
MQNRKGEVYPRSFGRALAVLLVLTAVLALAFRFWPGLDLMASGLFHDPTEGFLLAGKGFWESVIVANKAASFAYLCVALVLLPFSLWLGRGGPQGTARYWGMVILLYLAGPGILVNGLLKRSFGRARPVNVEIFGGDGPFTAAWEVSDYCRAACSFVSAEVAAGTALTVGLALGTLWFAGRPVARLFSGLAVLSLGLLVLTAVERIGSGRHFLSDVVFAALSTAAISVGLACLLWPRPAISAPAHVSGSIP